MVNLWDVRPRQQPGDRNADSIFLAVGAALTAWEQLESSLAELFDCLVSGSVSEKFSNRAGIAAFIAVSSSSGRSQLIKAAMTRALADSDHLPHAEALMEAVDGFGAHRNELAHGRVFNLGEHGYQLGPNNTNPRKWRDKGPSRGQARYQYNASDVKYYTAEFLKLDQSCKNLIKDIFSERSAKDRSCGKAC